MDLRPEFGQRSRSNRLFCGRSRWMKKRRNVRFHAEERERRGDHGYAQIRTAA
jgi:hypothetical protein